MIKQLYLSLMVFISVHSYAENLGVIGKTYPIGEQNLLDYIKAKATNTVNSGQWENLRKKVVWQTEQRIDHPAVIPGISPTIDASVHYFDPSVRINHDIINPFDKSILAHAGQMINPTTYMPFNNELIFIDGRIKEQVEYALAESKRSPFRTSIVLIAANNFRDLMKQEQHLFFYDQGATLVTKFQIRHVPTIIYQDQIQPTKLRVEEIKL